MQQCFFEFTPCLHLACERCPVYFGCIPEYADVIDDHTEGQSQCRNTGVHTPDTTDTLFLV